MAVVGPAAIILTAIALSTLSGPPVLGCQDPARLYLVVPVFAYVTVFGGPLGEGAGWRGYALPRLQHGHNPTTAALLVGLAWALWHAPLFAIDGTVQQSVPATAFGIQIITTSVVYTWLWNRTESLPLVIAFHVRDRRGGFVLPDLFGELFGANGSITVIWSHHRLLPPFHDRPVRVALSAGVVEQHDATMRCAPPQNSPNAAQRATCSQRPTRPGTGLTAPARDPQPRGGWMGRCAGYRTVDQLAGPASQAPVLPRQPDPPHHTRRSVDPARRQLPREPAQHLHRSPDRRDARRGASRAPRRRPGLDTTSAPRAAGSELPLAGVR